jgi:hypothetical protein
MTKIKAQFILKHPTYPLTIFKQTPTFYIITYREPICYNLFFFEIFGNKSHNFNLYTEYPIEITDLTFKICEYKITIYPPKLLIIKVKNVISFIDSIGGSIQKNYIPEKEVDIYISIYIINDNRNHKYISDELKLMLRFCNYDVVGTIMLIDALNHF